MRSFLKAFVYAFCGIKNTVKTERNFRIHIIAAVYVTGFSFFYDLSKTEYILLILTFLSVMVAELINTAIETVVDICSPDYSELAEFAKDAAAGAVLISASGAVITGIILFADMDIIKNIIVYYSENIFALIGLAVATVIALLFIVFPQKHKTERK